MTKQEFKQFCEDNNLRYKKDAVVTQSAQAGRG